MQIPKRRGEWRKKIGPADEYLTPEAIDGLKKELERLQKHAQPKAIAELQRTREMGDLSENAAYTEAKGRVLRLESVIFGIKERLKRAKTIQLGGTGEIVTVGSTVVVEVNGKQKTLLILGEQQVDPLSGKISFHSPVGAALMGKTPGDVVTVTTIGKRIEYKIISVN